MSTKTAHLALSAAEKSNLRKAGMRIADLLHMPVATITDVLSCDVPRAREIHARVVFTAIPSVGIKFAEDLMLIGYYTLKDLADKTGPQLIHELELKTAVWQDPCVEDQCRLVVHYARHGNTGRQWWHFTAERKAYRAQYGYPADRPAKAWYELLGYSAR